MADYNFGEKNEEYSSKRKENIPVWKSPKYQESRAKAVEIIDSGKYGVRPSDFWILMNETRNGKMAYTGLIISHNGCLKINDRLESRFDPECVSMDKDGYRGSLVYSYCNQAQGIYEVGEVSERNCKNEYPYAMAYKRLFDRVVLKLSKLAYAGIYSDSEADEFTQRLDGGEEDEPFQPRDLPICEECGSSVFGTKKKDGSVWTPQEVAEYAEENYGRTLCHLCMRKLAKTGKAADCPGGTGPEGREACAETQRSGHGGEDEVSG